MKGLSTFRFATILILLVLVAVSILFGVLVYQDNRDEGKLADEVDAVEMDIARLAQLSDIDALETELASLMAQLNDVPFPQDVDTNEVFGLVDESAATANVTVSWAIKGMSTQPIIDGSDLEYRVYRYEVTASGALSNIFDFLRGMEENAPYETMRLDEVELTWADIWSITFTILVFAQPSLE